MTQLELPLCSVFTVRVQSTIDIPVPAESAKAAKKLVEQQFFPQISRPKILGVYRSDMMPAKEENEDEVPKPPGGSPRGRPNPGGTQGGGQMKIAPPLVDVIAKVA